MILGRIWCSDWVSTINEWMLWIFIYSHPPKPKSSSLNTNCCFVSPSFVLLLVGSIQSWIKSTHRTLTLEFFTIFPLSTIPTPTLTVETRFRNNSHRSVKGPLLTLSFPYWCRLLLDSDFWMTIETCACSSITIISYLVAY